MAVITAIVCIGLICSPERIKVHDGDSFRIGSERYRVLGIDAPEINGACQKEIDYAQAARDRLEDLLRGKTVNVKPVATDRYGRTLAEVRVEDIDVGEVILKDGLARRWTKKWDRKPEPWCQL